MRFQGFLGVVVGLGWWGWVGEVVFPVEVDGVTVVNGQNVTVSGGSVGVGVGRGVVVWGW